MPSREAHTRTCCVDFCEVAQGSKIGDFYMYIFLVNNLVRLCLLDFFFNQSSEFSCNIYNECKHV